jgi:tungstate transport system ATP-binding protein
MRAPVNDLPIMFEDVSLLARGVAILERISLTLAPGAPTVLIGPNGAGKTTLLRLAMGLMAPSSGRITWGGREALAPTRRGIVFQRPVMLRRSVVGNLRYALAASGWARRERESRVASLLDLVGLTSLADRPARRLSGGEQQRLALARALAKDPAVLFLDEPTASLDPAATKAIEDLVRTITARNIKVIMSTHNLGQARRLAGDVIVMHRGRIVERGDAAALFTSPRSAEAAQFIAGELLV